MQKVTERLKSVVPMLLIGAFIALIGVFVGGQIVVGAGEEQVVSRDKTVAQIVEYKGVNSFIAGKKTIELDNLSSDKLSKLENNYKIIIVKDLKSRPGFETQGVIEGNQIKITIDAPEGLLIDLINKALNEEV